MGDGLEDITLQVVAPEYYYGLMSKRPRNISFKLDEDELERLDQVAKLLNMSRSELIRAAINDYLNRLFKAIDDTIG